MGWWSGSKDKVKQISTLTPEQQQAHGQLGAANAGYGAGGAFGDVADYYRNNLSNNPADFNAFTAPQLRQYNEDIVPGISEQFAGMGAGGLSSSGFRNAQVQGATDLSERLGAIRANLRQSSAQGLQSIGQQYLNPVQENLYMKGQPGFGQGLASGIGQALPSLAMGDWGGAAMNFGKGLFNGGGNKVGANTGPYGPNGPSASPQNNMPMRA